jgi:sterol desaturase/sphingolipid hydroxylase (fatty acid hydroxylase superfamily)
MEVFLNSPSLIIGSVVFLLIFLEKVNPLVRYVKDNVWLRRLLVVSVMGIFLTQVLGSYFEKHLDWHGLLQSWTMSLPFMLRVLIGYLIITFIVYWWHRVRHYNHRLWQLFHQIHHSTYRIQCLTAVYAHPLDFLGTALIVNTVSYPLLGCDVKTAVWVNITVNVFDFWEHCNVPTPRWLGYIIVRPEMHRIHHERERHTKNFSIPIWDIIFGTYENPTRTVECGFSAEAEKRLGEMLFFKRVE